MYSFNLLLFGNVMFYKMIILVLLLIVGNILMYVVMIISGICVIFLVVQKEVNVCMNNKGIEFVLVQVWVDDGSSNVKINNVIVFFIVMLLVFCVESGKG